MYLVAARQHPAWPELTALAKCWAVVAIAGCVAVLIHKAGGPRFAFVAAVGVACYAVYRLRKCLRAFRLKVKQCRR